MGGSSFELVAALAGAQHVNLSGVSAITVHAAADEPVAYVVDGPDLSVARAYRIGADGIPWQADAVPLPQGMAVGVTRDLSIGTLDGQDVAIFSGFGTTGVHIVDLASDGTFGAARALSGDLPPDRLQGTFSQVPPGGTDPVIYGFVAGAPAPLAWRVAGGTLTTLAAPAPALETSVSALAHSASGIVLATSEADHALVSYLPDAQGQLTEVARLGAAQGVGINAPGVLSAISAHGSDFAIVGGSGSSTLSVFEVDHTGDLTLRDHIMDGRDSRFAGVTLIDSVVVDGRAYIAAAGSDDGLSLFEMLPGGRLVILATQADTLGMTLDNPSAIALTGANGALSVLVSSESEPGLTTLRYDLQTAGGVITVGGAGGLIAGGQFDDLLIGGTGDDDLRAGDGADMIGDGEGADTLYGGAGADIFVMSQDGRADLIADFQPGIDRIDLSAWTFLRNTDQLEIAETADGAQIQFGYEVLGIQTADGTPLDADVLRALDLLGPARYMPFETLTTVTAEPDALLLDGTDSSDVLTGGQGADSINGYAGDDTLIGGGGDDMLSGGTGHDTAVYFAPVGEYDIQVDSSGVGLWITHVGGLAADGADWLTGVEVAQFAGGLVDLAQYTGAQALTMPPDPPAEDAAMWAWADMHLRTFDGVGYDFHAAGEFVLLRDTGLQAGFEVQARLTAAGPDVTTNQAIAIRTAAGEVMIDAADDTPLSIDGVATSIGADGYVDIGLDRLYLADGTYSLVFAGADGIVNAGDSRVSATLRGDRVDFGATLNRADYGGRLQGLLGDGDANPDNDIALAGGTALDRPLAPGDLYGLYSDDWRVKTLDQSLFSYDTGESPDGFYLSDFPADAVLLGDFSAAEITEASLQAEGAGLFPGTLTFDNAVLDLLVTNGDPTYLDAALDALPADDTELAMVLKQGQGRAALSVAISDGASSMALEGADVTFVADLATAPQALGEVGAGQYRLDLGEGTAGQVRVTKIYDAGGSTGITVADALEALRMSVGLTPSWGPAGAMHLLAADMNGDGAVTVADALAILRHAVGLESPGAEPRWLFLPPGTDTTSADIGTMAAPAIQLDLDPVYGDHTLDMTAILIGNVDMA
ncbi:MAG: hypothetical protein FH759_10415 [Sediminimonas qiaohouensis]|uniref:VWFD domain-containing protein n=1 Tax=Sediminimonas qiaohouensis TaxID=552061 RepID=A0A7C9HBC4_9RHOB|nr:VWD domain-containing protein [Sediminimonas qiaohouensis]MTJ05089.1 hypothetical protein [Sediminimonas qiaohouensis]